MDKHRYPKSKFFVCRGRESEKQCLERFKEWKMKFYPEDKIQIIDIKPCLSIRYSIINDKHKGEID
ncbi:MAG: hypothetical protein PVH73_01595 [Candidatus Bathyarchaeota archaeon]